MHVDIAKEVEIIWRYLAALRRPIAAKRRNGLHPHAFERELKLVNMKAPDDLVKLYNICDGTETSDVDLIGDITFFPGFYWFKLSDAVKVYQSLIGGAGWRKGWLPIFANGGGDFYAVICDVEDREYGSVVGYVAGEGEQLVEFQSVATMVRTISLSFQQSAFYVANDYLEADFPRMREIAKIAQPQFAEHVV